MGSNCEVGSYWQATGAGVAGCRTCSSWRSLLWFLPLTSSLLTPDRSATLTRMNAKQPYVSICARQRRASGQQQLLDPGYADNPTTLRRDLQWYIDAHGGEAEPLTESC